ncbi:putative F420-0 ABC transporter substrate-binding protein [Nocardioides daphniae]|uniref:ABC transporter substrate-binding protein n=1 Tax=Nocardioides daphniae TaxID=402297 RepID=A0A4P7U9W7_9ACTN|nr:putative F420-0 ABC transporter substrate-binding protein [Nocardioides daphniae]QCC76424.1 putative F420-0 ABC transporter substrate-binding protein [Nocardioides daphniae]GGD06848.1 ABC transporter substrate-binding protein [Nocardioides daphniae]
MRRSRPALLAAVLPAALLGASLLAGCGSEEPAADTAGSASGFPVTVRNCGVDVTVDSAPQRIVTIKSTTTELVLALGLGDKLVGTAFLDGPIREDLAAAADAEQISDQAPSQEAVLEREPDLVFAGWESNLAADTAGERDTLAKLGVASYVAPSACQSADAPAKMTYDLLFEEFEEAGRLLGAPGAATDLVESQQAALDEVGRVADGTTALWWSSGVDTPFVGGGTGAPQMVMERVGLTNVAGDVEKTWTPMGWEAIVDADPDVIVLVDAAWNTADQKVKDLEANPATAQMKAVKEKRYLVIPFAAGEAGVRSVDAAADLVEQARDLGLAVE